MEYSYVKKSPAVHLDHILQVLLHEVDGQVGNVQVGGVLLLLLEGKREITISVLILEIAIITKLGNILSD